MEALAALVRPIIERELARAEQPVDIESVTVEYRFPMNVAYGHVYSIVVRPKFERDLQFDRDLRKLHAQLERFGYGAHNDAVVYENVEFYIGDGDDGISVVVRHRDSVSIWLRHWRHGR